MPSVKPLLLCLLRERYPHARYDGLDAGPIATFNGPPEVGDLQVFEEGAEATVVIGKLTHTHFNGFESYPRDPKVSDEEVAKRVAEEVLGFLEDFFAERIAIWTEADGVVSLGSVEAMPAPDARRRAFSWKGRLKP